MAKFHAGELDEAVEQSLSLVKRNPTDTGLRFQLAELCCIAGDLERADRQLDTVVNQDPQAAVGAALFRQLIRAELSRRECFWQGRVPEFIGDPDDRVKEHLRALVAIQAGDFHEAGDLLALASERSEQSDTLRTHWLVNGQPTSELRDLDDVLAPVLEIHTTTGKYFWIRWNQIESITLHPPKRPVDLLWRQATLSVSQGPDGEVYVPTVYLPASAGETSDASLRLGRSTDWVEHTDRLVCGRGQKTLLVGDEQLPWMQIESIETLQPNQGEHE